MEGNSLDKLDFSEITNGYAERIRRLALFDPLFELERKREKDGKDQWIDMKGLGILTLLFFFEQKLLRQYKTGSAELTRFLKEMTNTQYQLDDASYEKLARSIIQTFRPTTGKKRSYPFFNWETKLEETIEYSILKAKHFDVKSNTQFYTLDEDGLELLFATKEFYSEFQLSINQLLLRKQLDKGEFKGALRQINEMRIDVESLEERMLKLKHEIMRSIVSEETFERYKKLLDDIYGRLEREDEEFKELRQFVKETRERLYSKDIHQKETKTYELILQIIRELEQVHYEHSRLLEQTVSLKNTTLVTAQESLYYTGIQAFNFDQDIVATVISTPLPLESLKGILHPFLKVEENPLWSPLTILAEQNITEEREEKHEQQFLEAELNSNDQPYQKWLRKKYQEIMSLFLDAYEQGFGDTLSSFIEFLEKEGQAELIDKAYFYNFWLLLHQRSPLVDGQLEDDDGNSLLGDTLKLLGKKTMLVTEGKTVLQKVKRYSIQEMNIVLEDKEHELF